MHYHDRQLKQHRATSLVAIGFILLFTFTTWCCDEVQSFSTPRRYQNQVASSSSIINHDLVSSRTTIIPTAETKKRNCRHFLWQLKQSEQPDSDEVKRNLRPKLTTSVNGASAVASSSSTSSSTNNNKRRKKQQRRQNRQEVDSGDDDRQEEEQPRIAVSVDELEKDLQLEEKTAVRVVRQAGPSVAFVTSVLPISTSSTTGFRERRNRRRRNNSQKKNDKGKNSTTFDLPEGISLGSGSAFIVDPDGYLVTNYHVIESAYQMQKMDQQLQKARNEFIGNITNAISKLPPFLSSLGLEQLKQQQRFSFPFWNQTSSSPTVYIRLKTETNKYRPCRIVHVQPDLDLAILQMVDQTTEEDEEIFPSVSFGSSSNLLVGQGLIAIGNPFGLDNSVTTGVVSALNRELQTGGGRRRQQPGFVQQPQQPIRNCIQTDCAINPGNSGGPLLNSQGQVVGVNTAIVSTTGSFAGIGFAVPSDAVQPVVERVIRNDKISNPRRSRIESQSSRSIPWLGVQIAHITPMSWEVVQRTLEKSANNDDFGKNGKITLEEYLQSSPYSKYGTWICSVSPNSPADQAGIRGMLPPLEQCNSDDSSGKGASKQNERGSTIQLGDAIVAVGGNSVFSFAELQAELANRKVGEQVSITLEDGITGERRVVYLVLANQPASKP